MMMSPTLKTYSGLLRNRQQILRFAGVPATIVNETAALENALDACLKELPNTIQGGVLFTEVPVKIQPDPSAVLLGRLNFHSRNLLRHLEGCTSCILLAATVGLAYDRLIRKYTALSPSKALWFQAIGASDVETMLDHFCEEMAEEKGPMTSRFSPGYGDLSLKSQKEIFALLQPEKALGLTLNESLLMSPSKSVTAIVGIRTNHDQ